MALKTPAAVKDTTNTNGTGTYTLNDSATPGGGYRTAKDAVADGNLANSDTVYYMCLDDTTEGGSLAFEYGLGTIGSGGLTLTRDTVHQSSNGGAKVNWAAGGTRTVLIVTGDWLLGTNNLSDVADADTAADNIGAARLNASNTFSGEQSIDGGASFARIDLESDLSSGVVSYFQTTAKDSAANDEIYSQLRTRITDATNGSEDSVFEMTLKSAGSLVESQQFNADGSITNSVSGNKFDSLPSGTKLLFGAAPPTGWTRVNESQSRLIRLAKSGDTVGSTGGSDDVFDGAWATALHTLTTSEMPAHNHDVDRVTGTTGSVIGLTSTGNVLISPGANTETVGGGAGHSHSLNQPYYAIACWATKD